ncbi:unnamed protein product [Trichogramma brassicae]|uniref:N-acetylglucosamine-6-phosphate deacetylase n=1 Tax=Trichogramma brassicae TaxID=86971 RepID=A0A6H5J0W7_9HYME|nr:unnamed protein product [Trichogramma brassicae]
MPESTSGQLKHFHNCQILRDGKILTEDLWVRDGKIIDPEKIFYDEKIEPDVKIDCNGCLISPGFIDVQINGGFGIDFSHNVHKVEEGVTNVAKKLLAYGVTSFCPTLVTSPVETYKKILPKIKRTNGGDDGAAILGVHVEGPFLNPLKKGAHPESCIQKFEKGFQSLLDVYGSLENICYITLAPELENAIDVIQELEKKILKYLLFHHRDPGLVGLLASDQIPKEKSIHYGIIADGVHTHPAALRIAHRTHPEGLVLVTDAISALGLQDGVHQLGQFDIEVRESRAYIAETNTLCGSIADMAECVRFFKKSTGCSVVEALEAATLHPARFLGIQSHKGVLNFGAQADFVFLDKDLHVISTWISGHCVHKA